MKQRVILIERRKLGLHPKTILKCIEYGTRNPAFDDFLDQFVVVFFNTYWRWDSASWRSMQRLSTVRRLKRMALSVPALRFVALAYCWSEELVA